MESSRQCYFRLRRPNRHLYVRPRHGILPCVVLETNLATQKAVSTVAQVPHTSRLAAYGALIAGIICVAWAAIFVRWTDIPGSASAFYRMMLPALILLPTFFVNGKREPIRGRTLGIIAIGGVFFALDLAFYNTAILKTTAANAQIGSLQVACHAASRTRRGASPPA